MATRPLPAGVRRCGHCMAITRGWRARGGELRCAICHQPIAPSVTAATVERQRISVGPADKKKGRRRETPVSPRAPKHVREFLRSDAGTPLGISGASLRLDGESHFDSWKRLVREDPCSYCGRRKGGTVDHIEPKRKPVRGLGGAHSWLNLTGACESCNGSKKDQPLLVWLARRGVLDRED